MNAIKPIDAFVREGFQQRFSQVFGCTKALFINQNDKTQVLKRLFAEGEPFTYPYAYFVENSISAASDRHNGHRWVRRGLPVTVDSNETYQSVRVLPVNFDIEITYVTNKFNSIDQGSVTAFARRWLLARRAGYLKFSIDYGRLQFKIGALLNESVTIPQLQNVADSETKYEVSIPMTIYGYVSEPILSTQGKVNKLNVNAAVGAIKNGKVVATQTFTFPTKT